MHTQHTHTASGCVYNTHANVNVFVLEFIVIGPNGYLILLLSPGAFSVAAAQCDARRMCPLVYNPHTHILAKFMTEVLFGFKYNNCHM